MIIKSLSHSSIGSSIVIFLFVVAFMFAMAGDVSGYDTLNLGERELSRGDEGADVAILQRQLASSGYYKGAIDGLFGPKTYQAVKDFQSDNNLTVTGIADSRTLVHFSQRGLISKLDISRSELLALARVIYGEARGESFQGMVGVGAVILNRTVNDGFPGSITEVIREDGQFSSLMDGQANLYPDERAMDAARAALMGYDPSRGALFFYNPEIATNLAWISQRPVVKTIGNHVFAK